MVKGLPKISTEFDKWVIYFCDERIVPENDPESTFGLYKKTLIDSRVVNLKESQFITIKPGVSGMKVGYFWGFIVRSQNVALN